MSAQPHTSPSRDRRLLRLLLRLLLVTFAATLGLELAIRFFLFSSVASDWAVARRLRQPRLYADWRNEERWYVLQHLWLPPENRDRRPPRMPHHDPRVGWTSDRFLPGTYEHLDEGELGGRRPILLFGDSFSACVANAGICFEALLEESGLGERYALLNYGVNGYGLDQTYLLMEPVLDRFAALDPIVIVGLLVDDDLDRCLLDFRSWPKPRLRVEAGDLSLPASPVPTMEEYLADAPPLPSSYSLELFRSALGWRALGDDAAQASEKQRLAQAILGAITAELRSRGLGFFFLLFNAPETTLDPLLLEWRQSLVREELERNGVPWVEVRDDLLRAADSFGYEVDKYFFPISKHLNLLGNEVAFDTILRGVAPQGLRCPPMPWSCTTSVAKEDGGVAQYQHQANSSLGIEGRGRRLLLRGGRSSAARIIYSLDGLCRAWRCEAWCFDPSGQEEGLELVVDVDGEERWRGLLSPEGEHVPLQVDLTGADELVLRTPARMGSVSPACLVLAEPVIE